MTMLSTWKPEFMIPQSGLSCLSKDNKLNKYIALDPSELYPEWSLVAKVSGPLRIPESLPPHLESTWKNVRIPLIATVPGNIESPETTIDCLVWAYALRAIDATMRKEEFQRAYHMRDAFGVWIGNLLTLNDPEKRVCIGENYSLEGVSWAG